MKQYRRKKGVDSSTSGERAVIYDPHSGAATILNPTGSILWEKLTSDTTVPQLSTALQEAFPSVGADQAATDVQAFLASLEKAGLIEISGAA